MNSNNNVALLHQLMMTQLGGVYHDPARITRDAADLLTSMAGNHLKPFVAPLVENDGTSSPPVLYLSGTIAMPYRGATYNIPIDLYLPQNYPARAPVAFVRPVSTMEVKERHPHVAVADGRVYMPYLHSWRNHSHNLVELVVTMSSLFSADPPVFAKPPAPVARPPPPAYSSVHQQQQQQQAVMEEQIRLAQEMSRKEEEQRRQREEEAQRQKMQQYEAQQDHEKKMQLHTKINTALYNIQTNTKREMEMYCMDIVRMENNAEKLLRDNNDDNEEEKSQFQTLQERKQQLEMYQEELATKTEQLETFVRSVEEQKNESSSGQLNIDSVDKIAVPDNLHSQQMLVLSAEVAAISDLMYFMDRALVKETLPLDVHLKEIRRLAKKQFMTRALLLKVGAVVMKERSQRNLMK